MLLYINIYSAIFNQMKRVPLYRTKTKPLYQTKYYKLF